MVDFERIDKCEKDITLLTDLYSKVVTKLERTIDDCAETFAIIADGIQTIEKQIQELKEELEKSASSTGT